MHIRLGDKQGDGQSGQQGVKGQALHYFKEAEALIREVRAVRCKGSQVCPIQVGVYIATDSGNAVTEARAWAAQQPHVRLVVANTLSQNVSKASFACSCNFKQAVPLFFFWATMRLVQMICAHAMCV